MSDSLTNSSEACVCVDKESKSGDNCGVWSGDWALAEDEPSEEASTEDDEPSWREDWSEAEPLGDDASDSDDVLELLGGAYRKLQCIGGGGFGEVYLVRDVDSCQDFAAKVAEEDCTLVWEAELLERLRDVSGFPVVHYCGVRGRGAVMVVDLLGHSLAELRSMCGNRLTLKSVLMIADQVLQRLEDLHSRGIVHRDIKSDNFMLGRGDKSDMIYAIDLGLANEYWDAGSDQHIPYRTGLDFTGTASYISAHAHSGAEQSRRDDLESVGYMLISLLQGDLPWESSCDPSCSETEWREHCAKEKASMSLCMICHGCPEQFQQYLMYCRNLQFAEEPDYQYLRSLFREVFHQEGLLDDGVFDWCEQISRTSPITSGPS